MEPKFEASIQYSENVFEQIHYINYKLRSEKKIRSLILILMLFFIFIIDIRMIIDMGFQNCWWIMLLLDLILLIVGLFMMYSKSTARKIVKGQTQTLIKNMKEPFEKVDYQFFDDYYIVETSVSKTEYKYESVMGLVDTEKIFILFTSKVTFMCFDKKGFNESEIDDFKNFIERKTNLKINKV